MPLRVGLLTAAHLHVGGYAAACKHHPDVELIGMWDDQPERGKGFSEPRGIPFIAGFDELMANVDAVVITSENMRHCELALKAAAAGKHILCEKPLAATEEHGAQILEAAEKAGVKLMTAFPCRFSPAFQLLKARVANNEIGSIRAICATNRGRCPFGWFVEPALSGGGSMIDHVVHVTDLLRDLLGEEPVRVQAQIGNNVYGQDWEDTAMLTIEFESGIFATLDSSWSRPSSYHTWGDVTMNVVGEHGVIELDMFGQSVQRYAAGELTHTSNGYGTDLDAAMVDDFVRACLDDRPVKVNGFDGMQAARVAIAGYKSVQTGQPVAVSA
ncbi:MAG: Gfo/Idh/MocA family oxidoreductase [Fimbriimonas sp.]|nr:Gfo/Idh/MocA family oxidoreductase [Fimbriimonas sp.]